MRITDSRYDRDRLRLTVACRLIRHEARTHTIRQCTGLSGDRIRKLYRSYMQEALAHPLRRRRGKSPRQMSYFRRSPAHELQAATLGMLLSLCGLLGRRRVLRQPTIEEVARFCDVYETFESLCPIPIITLEHAWYLLQVLAYEDEFVLARCPDCQAAWIRDTLEVLPDTCAACRVGVPPD